MWSGKLMIDSLSKDVLDKKLNDRLVYVINTYKQKKPGLARLLKKYTKITVNYISGLFFDIINI